MATEGIHPSQPFSEDTTWPALGTKTALVVSNKEEEQQQRQETQTSPPLELDSDEDDWEDIEACDYPPSAASDNRDNQKPLSNQAQTAETAAATSENPKVLRHCVSSPNFSCLTNMKDLLLEDVLEEVPEREGDDEESFSMVSGVASVKSMDTRQSSATTTTLPTKTTTISWKDKVAKLANDGDHGSLPGSVVSPASQHRKQHPQPPRTQRPLKKASRIVVVATPMRRSAKSTGDLPSLAEEATNNSNNSDEEEILGATDAADFYHRKALGAASRTSGLRMRPDEAKRKQFTLDKKAAQRNGRR